MRKDWNCLPYVFGRVSIHPDSIAKFKVVEHGRVHCGHASAHLANTHLEGSTGPERRRKKQERKLAALQILTHGLGLVPGGIGQQRFDPFGGKICEIIKMVHGLKKLYVKRSSNGS